MVKFDRKAQGYGGKSRYKGFYNSFKSGLEYEAGDFLRARENQYGYVSRYEPEKLHYSFEGTYKPDFVLTFVDKHKMYIETKGYMDNDSRRKMASVRKANPNLDIRMVFSKDDHLRKNLPMTYSKWAEKIGFPWAIKTIPEEWLKSPVETMWQNRSKLATLTAPNGKVTSLPSNILEDVVTDLLPDGTG